MIFSGVVVHKDKSTAAGKPMELHGCLGISWVSLAGGDRVSSSRVRLSPHPGSALSSRHPTCHFSCLRCLVTPAGLEAKRCISIG